MIFLFIGSFTVLLISLGLFWNQAIFVDEYGLSPVDVTGGEFWLTMDWLRIFLLCVLTIVTGFSIRKKTK